MQHDKYVNEQLEYYRARAPEYDEWFLRQGRYDQGDEHTKQWFAEVALLQAKLASLKPYGKVLELACGTGWWTEQLVKGASSLRAVDASSEVMGLNKQRVASDKVTYQQADIFKLELNETFDLIFFSFWLSHVPPERFEAFWNTVNRLLAPKGRVFLIDSLYKKEATAKNQSLGAQDGTVAKRTLNDGRSYDIVKLFYTPDNLSKKLGALGWQVDADQTKQFFVFAEAKR